MIVGVDGTVMQKFGCFAICRLRHELCALECNKQTPIK